MKRHWMIALVLVLCTVGSTVIGHIFGRHRGERAAEDRRAALAAAADSSLRTGPPPAERAGKRKSPSPQATPRSRDAIKRSLADLKTRMYNSSGSPGSLSISLNEEAAAEALDRWSLEEVRLALETVGELPPGLDKYGFSMVLLQRWAREDPEGALAYHDAHRDEADTFRGLWLHAIFAPWIENDPVEAARALVVVLNREPAEINGGVPNAVLTAAETLSQKDPGAAMQFVAALPDWARASARTSVAKLVQGDGRAAFLDSLRALSSGPEATDWQRAAAAALAPVDPGAASQWIDSLGLSQEDTRETTRSVFEHWKNHNPQAAVDWAAARLPLAEKTLLMTRAVESWAAREPNECGRWLGSFDPAPEFDHVVAAFAQAVKSKDPGSARAWADRITDPKIRADTLQLLGP